MMRRALVGTSATLAAVIIGVIVVSFVRPLYESQTERLIGEPAKARRAWFSLDSGSFHIKYGRLVSSPPTSRSRPVHWGVFSFSTAYLPGPQAAYHLRTITVSLWALFAMLALYPTLVFIRGPLRRRRRRERGRCARCGYELTGNVTGICSECGQPIAGHRFAP